MSSALWLPLFRARGGPGNPVSLTAGMGGAATQTCADLHLLTHTSLYSAVVAVRLT